LTRRVPAPLLVLAAVVSVQFGGALARDAGSTGRECSASVALRLTVAAVGPASSCPSPAPRPNRKDWLVVGAFGGILAVMNLFFYGSLARLPIGVAVTVEFIGPLVLATVLSRRPKDLFAVAGAAVGVVLISGITSTPLAAVDLTGLDSRSGRAAAWAAYIVFSGPHRGEVRRSWTGWPSRWRSQPCWSLRSAWSRRARRSGTPDALWRGAAIAILSSVLPYSLELIALRRLAPTSSESC
jgi:inner membrane transporter RhtA